MALWTWMTHFLSRNIMSQLALQLVNVYGFLPIHLTYMIFFSFSVFSKKTIAVCMTNTFVQFKIACIIYVNLFFVCYVIISAKEWISYILQMIKKQVQNKIYYPANMLNWNSLWEACTLFFLKTNVKNKEGSKVFVLNNKSMWWKYFSFCRCL